jgi:hypothetical protein
MLSADYALLKRLAFNVDYTREYINLREGKGIVTGTTKD